MIRRVFRMVVPVLLLVLLALGGLSARTTSSVGTPKAEARSHGSAI